MDYMEGFVWFFYIGVTKLPGEGGKVIRVEKFRQKAGHTQETWLHEDKTGMDGTVVVLPRLGKLGCWNQVIAQNIAAQIRRLKKPETMRPWKKRVISSR